MRLKVADALRAATERLSATSDTARLDAELLMAHALGCTRTDLLLRHMQSEVPAAFAALVLHADPLDQDDEYRVSEGLLEYLDVRCN